MTWVIGYTYNERGWLRTSGTSANGVSTNLLHIDLRYNSADAATQQFNGNIAEMHYTGPTSGTKVFDYTYDPLNRLAILLNLPQSLTSGGSTVA